MPRTLAHAIQAAWVLMVAAAAPAAAASPDAVFVTKAAEAGARMVELAKVGAAKAAATDVKACAQHMAFDHRALGADLGSLARSKDVRVPAPSPAAVLSDVAARAGAAFDRAFLVQVVKEHEALISLFEGESRDGRDSDVKEWAAKQLPALREHLAKVRSLATRHG
jgi:putative membrane protein